jgi:hypothetical protein
VLNQLSPGTNLPFYLIEFCYATTPRWVDIPGPLLDNGSLNTFHSNRHEHNNRRAVFNVVRADVLSEMYKVSSVQEFVKRELEPEAEVQLLLEPLPGNV